MTLTKLLCVCDSNTHTRTVVMFSLRFGILIVMFSVLLGILIANCLHPLI